jgi:hypothetical protein
MAQYQGKPLVKGNELLLVLQKHLSGWNLSRQKFVVLFVTALLKTGMKSLLEIAGAFDSEAKSSSSLRRIERFLGSFDFCISIFGKLMIALMGLRGQKVYLLLDRTEWQFGKQWVNVMMLSVSVEGMSIPIFWRVYAKKGLSSQGERIALMQSFLTYFPDLEVLYLIADREFVGKDWFQYLKEAQIPFVMRLRENFQVSKNGETKSIKVYCRDVRSCQYYHKGHFKVCDTSLHIAVTYLQGELLILGSLQRDLNIFKVYQKRWGIETLFKALKTQGFQIENTAVTEPKKVEKLLFLIAIAFVWAYKTGVWRNQEEPVRICKNGHQEFSFFRYGFLFLQSSLLNHAKYQQLIMSIKKLSGD